MKKQLPLISTCLAAGAVVMAVIFCLLIRFGLNTMVGKEAIYTAFAFQSLNLAILCRAKGKKGPASRVCFWVWVCGGVFLLTALVLGILRLGFVSPWVRWPCLIGTVLAGAGWLGCLITADRTTLFSK